jgi:hypothetical protein
MCRYKLLGCKAYTFLASLFFFKGLEHASCEDSFNHMQLFAIPLKDFGIQ